MTDATLIGAIPDLVAFIRRDGVILEHLGGRGVAALGNRPDLGGQHVEAVWPAPVASAVMQLTRRALRGRASGSARFLEQGTEYEARVSPHGPDRVLCVIRNLTAEEAPADAGPGTATAAGTGGEAPAQTSRPQTTLARRGFLGRFKQSVADATLRDRTLALCVIHLDGLADIARIIDFNISEQLTTGVLRRLTDGGAEPGGGDIHRYAGQLGDGLLAAVVEGCADREAIRAVAQGLCSSIQEPVSVGDATFHLTPHAGVAILGRDALTAQLLLDHARAAALEARSSGRPGVHFYSDTIKLRSLARLDVAHELHQAIADGDVRLRYVGRHDLASGRLTTVMAYLRWPHRLRGAVRPAEFVPIAEHTGLATALSRAALARLRDDWLKMRSAFGPGVRISFSALRHHLASNTFPEEVAAIFKPGALAPEELELRISERTLAGLPAPERTFRQLAECGVRLVIDEIGRGVTSMAALAKLPLHALQLDRGCVVASEEKPSAMKICRAAIGMASGLELMPIATGVDSEQRRARLAGMGCTEGSGDLYAADFGIEAESTVVGERRRSAKARASS